MCSAIKHIKLHIHIRRVGGAMHNKRDLQTSAVTIMMIYHAHRWALDDMEMSTAEVMRLFGVSRSTASRIMDYAAGSSGLLSLEYHENRHGAVKKYICLDVNSALEVDASSYAHELTKIERNQDKLGVSEWKLEKMVSAISKLYQIQITKEGV